jgi:hypothetical protein
MKGRSMPKKYCELSILNSFEATTLTGLQTVRVIILLLCCFTNSYGQAASATNSDNINIEVKKRVIDSIVRQLRARYVLPEHITHIEEQLRAKLRNGSYDNAATAIKFAQALTQDLRSIGDDLHFDISYNPAREKLLFAAGSDKAEKLPDIELSQSEREMKEAILKPRSGAMRVAVYALPCAFKPRKKINK